MAHLASKGEAVALKLQLLSDPHWRCLAPLRSLLSCFTRGVALPAGHPPLCLSAPGGTNRRSGGRSRAPLLRPVAAAR